MPDCPLTNDKVRQMPSDTGTVIFYDQNFYGVALPEGGDDVSEETRGRAVAIGVYELWFRRQAAIRVQWRVQLEIVIC